MPRLLLNSACPGFEQGLANSSGMVGKYLMVQIGNVVLGRFEEPVRMYKVPPAHALTEVMYAAGAQEVVQEARYAHLVGGARMGHDPRISVTNSFGRTHDIANLFVCDGSLLPTQGSANPGLTIQALAARTADYLISNSADLLSTHPGAQVVTDPPIRYHLSPHGTAGRGVPRFVSGTRKRGSR